MDYKGVVYLVIRDVQPNQKIILLREARDKTLSKEDSKSEVATWIGTLLFLGE